MSILFLNRGDFIRFTWIENQFFARVCGSLERKAPKGLGTPNNAGRYAVLFQYAAHREARPSAAVADEGKALTPIYDQWVVCQTDVDIASKMVIAGLADISNEDRAADCSRKYVLVRPTSNVEKSHAKDAAELIRARGGDVARHSGQFVGF